MNIAVVDDEPAVREEICAWIKRQQPNCHMEAFASGEAILAAEKLFDIVSVSYTHLTLPTTS